MVDLGQAKIELPREIHENTVDVQQSLKFLKFLIMEHIEQFDILKNRMRKRLLRNFWSVIGLLLGYSLYDIIKATGAFLIFDNQVEEVNLNYGQIFLLLFHLIEFL